MSKRAVALFKGFQALPASLSGKSSIRWWVWSSGGVTLTGGKVKWAEKNLPPCHSVTQKCYMCWPRIELGSARWEAEPWSSVWELAFVLRISVWELAFVLHMGLLGRLLKEGKGFMGTFNFICFVCVWNLVWLWRKEISENMKKMYGVNKIWQMHG